MMKCIFLKALFSQQLDELYIQWEDSFLKGTPVCETTPYVSQSKIPILHEPATEASPLPWEKLIQPPNL